MDKPVDMVFNNAGLVKKYAEFRPVPPRSLVNTVVDYVKEKVEPLQVCVDIGCGSGQNTRLYSEHFKQVIGLDVSLEQLRVAEQDHLHQNVVYKEGLAEHMPVENASVDLVTSCAAVHWFNLDTFYKEVDRVLRPGGVLACYSYLACTPLYAGKNLRSTILEMHSNLDPNWSMGHRHLNSDYGTLPAFSPEEVFISSNEEKFVVETDATLDSIIGYLSSWSAVQKLQDREGEEVVSQFLSKCKHRLQDEMGTTEEDAPMRSRYTYFLRMWRKPSAHVIPGSS
ncbi:putative methyltransferase DDB_G0268948 [Homarus americanus]|uniref:putative methyltransferase DDB_G0268948 n=1 Tax=Homarus americanus TaxID=6706 RepID=UPI001C45F0C0|nr:putative methyltransferase DDB_G0268948 [Homarus americanus]XP_042226220.1 putative methyltransferase DDB_G0268948 [Homarus americanus]